MEGIEETLSLIFFAFTAIFLSFSILLYFLRLKLWCSCPVCRAYVNSTWRSDFDNISDWYAHLLRESPTQTIHIHVLGNTVTANPDNVEHVLKTRFDNYPKGKRFSSILGDLLGRGIFNVDGELWRFQRKLASLELGSLSVRSFAFHIVSNEVNSRLLPFLAGAAEGGGVVAPVDLQDVFRRFSFDTICRISFGLDPACLELHLPMSDFAGAFDAASALSARRATAALPLVWRIKRLLNIGSERELRSAIKLVNALASEVIRQRRKLGFAGEQDLLSRFMASVSDDNYLRDIVISFLLAGRDTVASALTTFFLLLSDHPDVVAKMREEIDAAMGESEAAASLEQLRSMNYVHAAMYESLRLYPPVQFDSKFCIEEDVLADGTFVSEGTRVTYHPYAMGRMEKIWGADCREFRPERWLGPGRAFVPASPFQFPVFQGGVRVCIGKEMSLMEMKAVMVAVVREFDVEVVGGSGWRPRFTPGLTATLSGGLPIRARRRAR